MRPSLDATHDANAAAQDEAKFDVWLTHFNLDLSFAMQIAAMLIERGYRVGPRSVVARADRKLDARLTPNEAKCVIALWTPNALDDLQVQGDARTAGLTGRLIEVGLRKACPVQRFSDTALIAFARAEITPHSDAGRALLARVRLLCGEPPRKTSDLMRRAPAVVVTAATVAGAFVVGAMWTQQADEKKEMAARAFAPPASQDLGATLLASAKRPSLTPPDVTIPESGGPGPNDFISEDLGTTPKAPPPAAALQPTAPPIDMGAQGPEQ